MLIIENAIYNIRENPPKYIGGPSLKRLDLFILGYTLSQIGREGTYQNLMGEFQLFLERKFESKTSRRFSEIIRNNLTSDEDAFNRFYILLDEFIENSNHKGGIS